ncbi:alpha/beta fold hydrolase [Flavobacterium taihuense]|uniref:Alpha/beta hydrolase n=1 Tax=Flavobacterium taihuense TaxID=2857508 RepID=A0ABS6XVC9_9FLAO|nr:alpha/beta hydrolase [Flavobacterium taihuense]MBW4360640.1 alpha/beta hydrolase [Flavobacterium taihuense]
MKNYNTEIKNTLMAILLAISFVSSAQVAKNTKINLTSVTSTTFKTIKVDGLDIFYREAGDKNKPTILLLHGFPSSSHMYRDLINDLSSKYHVIAPDYPGFGQSSAPSNKEYEYTFDNLSITVEHFIEKMGLKKFSLYMQDYGGPIGFRIAVKRPELIQSLIIQNANAYKEGLGDALAPLVAYIQNPNAETENTARGFLILDTTKWQYLNGAEDTSKVSPDSYTIDQAYLDRKGNDQIQLALFRNYGSNLPKYADWQAYLKKYQPATLVLWGKNDLLFTAPGAEAYKKDVSTAEVHLINGGHFLLEEHHSEAAKLIDAFLSKHK